MITHLYDKKNSYSEIIKTVYPQKDHNGKRPQWKKSMGIKTTVYSKTAWTILVIRPHQKERPLVGMATKQVMPHHFC